MEELDAVATRGICHADGFHKESRFNIRGHRSPDEWQSLQRLSSAVNMAAAHEIQNAISRGNRLPTAAKRGGKRYRSLVRAGL